ncbi:hypothetical protein AA313_de0202985 [Arthrobotrys entomopaga]|nr:hypothetical protein AA313_de0202985 [Arthrobotrys entomopaga]
MSSQSSSRLSGRRNTDEREDPMMTDIVIPREDPYIYTTASSNPGSRAPPRGEIRTGRSPHDAAYGASYSHEPVLRHGRPPIEATPIHPQDDDDEMQD